MLKMVTGENVNSFYNERTCCNGGGYWQPCGIALFKINGNDVVVDVEDTSCGDFGTRYFAEVSTDEHRWFLNWGTMEGEDEDLDSVLDSISGVLGVDAWHLVQKAMCAVDFCARCVWYDRRELDDC